MQMNNETRRKTLKTLALAAPAVWSKPVLNTVLLPAHAQTSMCSLCLTVHVTGSGGEALGRLGWDLLNQDGCARVDTEGNEGPPGFSQTWCNDLEPGTYSLFTSLIAQNGAISSMSIGCCDAEEPFGTTTTLLVQEFVVIVDENGGCTVTESAGVPCGDSV